VNVQLHFIDPQLNLQGKVDFAQNQLDHMKSVIIQQSVVYSHFLELYKNSETTEVFLYIINRCLLC
jgi:hypothetical protein